jgi:hypothetical protein
MALYFHNGLYLQLMVGGGFTYEHDFICVRDLSLGNYVIIRTDLLGEAKKDRPHLVLAQSINVVVRTAEKYGEQPSCGVWGRRCAGGVVPL